MKSIQTVNLGDILKVKEAIDKAEAEMKKLTPLLKQAPTEVTEFVIQLGKGMVNAIDTLESVFNPQLLITCYRMEEEVYKAMGKVLSEQASKT